MTPLTPLSQILCLLSLAAILTVPARAVSVSFATNVWTSGATGNTPTTQTGYLESPIGTGSTGSGGSTVAGGVTVTFTATFHGTSTRAGSPGDSFVNATGSTNPNGYIFGGFDNNSSTLTLNDTAKTISGTIVNYQRWDFAFSTPVYLDEFTIEDVDSNNSFRDIISAEAFAGYTPGVAGSGIDPVFTLGADVYQSGGATIGGLSIESVAAKFNLTNPNNTPEVRVGIAFGNVPIQSFSVYTFSDKSPVHRTSLSGSTFQFISVPEPSALLLTSLPLLALFRRRR